MGFVLRAGWADACLKDVLGRPVPTLFLWLAGFVATQCERRNSGAHCNGLPLKADYQRRVNLREQTLDICISASFGRGVRSFHGNPEITPAREPKERWT